MNDQELAAKIAAIKNATVPLSISPKDLGEVLEALSGTTAEQPISLQEVLEFDTFGEFPMEGVANTIYINKDDDKMYRWSGTEYIALNDPGTTITIRSLSDLDTQQTVGVYTVLYLRTINKAGPISQQRKVIVSYTLRVESSPGFISQYMENKEGYSWREFNTNTSTWYDWQNVTFATTAYVDEALSGIENLLASI